MSDTYFWLIDQVLKHPMWNEPVRVERVKRMGTHLSLRVVGVESNQYRSAVLAIEEVEQLAGAPPATERCADPQPLSGVGAWLETGGGGGMSGTNLLR